MSTERELAPGGPAQLHTLPVAFSDIGTTLQLNTAVRIIGKVYGKCSTLNYI